MLHLYVQQLERTHLADLAAEERRAWMSWLPLSAEPSLSDDQATDGLRRFLATLDNGHLSGPDLPSYWPQRLLEAVPMPSLLLARHQAMLRFLDRHTQDPATLVAVARALAARFGALLESDRPSPQAPMSAGCDATDRMRAERSLVSAVLHDLRSPLMAVNGALSVLDRVQGDALAGEASRFIAIAKNSAGRLTQHVDRLLEIERLESGRPVLAIGACDAALLVAEAIQAAGGLAEAKSVSIRSHIPSFILWADAHQVLHTLIGLLGHAVEASERGGVVTLRAEQAGPMLRLQLRHQARGVDLASLRHCLESPLPLALYEAVREGAPHGALLLSRDATERQGGCLGVEDDPAGGRSFWLSLPLQSLSGAPKAPRRPRVHIVDADPAIRLVMQTILEHHGCLVEVAPSVGPAPDAEGDRIDVFFVEACQFSAAQALIEAHPALRGTPVVMLGHVLEPGEPAPPNPPAGQLAKPFKAASLLEALKRAMSAPLEVP